MPHTHATPLIRFRHYFLRHYYRRCFAIIHVTFSLSMIIDYYIRHYRLFHYVTFRATMLLR